MNFAGRCFDDPFFDHTIQRLGGTLEQYDSDFEHEPAIATDANLEPTAFIFHMSRSGSTLFANCMRALDDSIVISEAQPCNTALTPFSVTLWPFESAAGRDRLLRRFVRYLGQRFRGGERRLFFKFTSWNTARLGIVRRLWPATPWIFLARDPVEVMVSNLKSNTGWMKLKGSPEQARALFGWRDANPLEMSDEEYCARVLGQFCWTARNLQNRRDIVVDYRDLNLATVVRVLGTLGIEPTSAETARLATQFGIYAKDPGQTRGFEADGGLKRKQATAYQMEMASKWAYPAYERLHTEPAGGSACRQVQR
jgi:hypothetical protein